MKSVALSAKHSVPLVVITRKMQHFITLNNRLVDGVDVCQLLHFFTIEDEYAASKSNFSGYPSVVGCQVAIFGRSTQRFAVGTSTAALVQNNLIHPTNSVCHYTSKHDGVDDPFPFDQVHASRIIRRPLTRVMWSIILKLTTPGNHKASHRHFFVVIHYFSRYT
jgi:hypothetical protein